MRAACGGICEPLAVGVQPDDLTAELYRLGPENGVSGERDAYPGDPQVRGEAHGVIRVGHYCRDIGEEVFGRRGGDGEPPADLLQ